MKPAPCLNCIVIPICRQRYFISMKNNCKLVEKYLFTAPAMAMGRNDFDFRVNRVHDAINPVHWKKRMGRHNYHYTQQFLTANSNDSKICFPLEII